MSWQSHYEPLCPLSDAAGSVDTVIEGRPRDLGGFEVRRLLPSPRLRAVGPFIFFDQMGPADFTSGTGIDVRPHPHIGLATVTYLFQGELLHRDSLGTVQPIRPGDVNWMTAGRGIAHSERTGPQTRAAGGPLFGIQAWVALPKPVEETEPAFAHYACDALPRVEDRGVAARVIAGEFLGRRSPVATATDTFYVDATLAPGGRLAVPAEVIERAIYVVSGRLLLGGHPLPPATLFSLRRGAAVELVAQTPVHVLLLGGEPLDAPRFLWWNFVSSSQARIEQAKSDWREGRFPPVPGDAEFIPLPEA